MKKLISLLLSVAMAVTIFTGINVTAQASGNSFATATTVDFGVTYNSTLTETGDYKGVYKFTIDEAGMVTAELAAYIEYSYYYIYNANGDEVWSNTSCYWNDNTKVFMMKEGFYLTKGSYYFVISKNKWYEGDNYTLKFTYTNSCESFAEAQNGSNNSMTEANSISLSNSYKGQLALNDRVDLYNFTISSSGKVNINLSAYIEYTAYFIYDTSGNTIWSNTYCEWNENTKVYKLNQALNLTKGTYYFAITDNDKRYNNSGNYNFKITHTSAKESFTETNGGNNNDILTADSISINKSYTGQLALNDSKDIYKFILKKAINITLSVTAYIDYTEYYLYDSNGKEVWSSSYNYWDSTGKMVMNTDLSLAKGTYYIAIVRYGNSYSYGTGNYSIKINCCHSWSKSSLKKATTSDNGTLKETCSVCGKTKTTTIKKISSVKLSTTTYTYSGNAKKPSVTVKNSSGKKLVKGTDYTVEYASGRKSTGKYKVTVKFKGNYSGEKKLYFKILPKKTSKISASVTRNKIKSSWKKVTGASGYKVQLKNSKGKIVKTVYTTKTKYTFSKLSKKTTYKVTVKAYKTIDGKKNYSKYSKTVKFKTKSK